MSPKAATFVERAWPILTGVVLVVASFVLTGATAQRAEAKADRALESINGTDENPGVRERLATIETLLRERLPPKPQ